jgi:hypothetical protein
MKERLDFRGDSRLLPDERTMVLSRVMSSSDESSLSFTSSICSISCLALVSASNSNMSLSRVESMVWLKTGSFRFSFSTRSI